MTDNFTVLLPLQLRLLREWKDLSKSCPVYRPADLFTKRKTSQVDETRVSV